MVNRSTSKNMEIIKNKRGIFFTAIALVIVSLLLISYTFFSQVNERKAIQKRIETMNNFLFSMEQDLTRQIRTSGFRIIFLMQKRIIEQGSYITNVNETFKEAFFNGTIDGTTNEEIQILMEGATFSGIVNNTNNKANKINAQISLENATISIDQGDPWNVRVTLETKLSLNDQSNLASWNRTTIITAFIPIEGFEDPLYPIESNNPGTINKINKTIYTSFDSSNLILHAQNAFYTENTDAPSFLDRLEGKIANQNPQGIESLAVPKLTSISGRSIVDHEYFSGTSGNQVPGMPVWFIIDIDPAHDIYEPI
jgi:type II secretory pathway pseudopilin PulG